MCGTIFEQNSRLLNGSSENRVHGAFPVRMRVVSAEEWLNLALLQHLRAKTRDMRW